MSDGELVNVEIAPGIYKNSTPLKSEGRYVDADKIRFHYGQPQKLGGWVTEQAYQHDYSSTSTTFTGVPRDIKAWQNNEADHKYLAVATNRKIEIFNQGQIFDITPIRLTATVNNALSTSAGSTLVLVSNAAHAAQQYDLVIFQSVSATSVGGITLSGQYEIASVVDVNSYYIDTLVTATQTSTSKVSTATISYLVNIGLSSNVAATGWGSGGWGRQGWGTPLSSGGGNVSLDQWSLDTFGEDLMICRRGGRIYWWDEDRTLLAAAVDRASVRATWVTASPSVNNLILVTQPSRYLVSFGCTDLGTAVFDPLLVRWSNQEDFNTWDPTLSVAGGNTSGSHKLKGGSQIIGAVQTRGEVLILTDQQVYKMVYSGEPYTFSFDQVGDNAGAVSQHCAVDIQGVVYWMGTGDFHMYNGQTKTLPCDIQEAIFRPGNAESLNLNQKEKVFAGVNSQFNEVIWLYPSSASEEIDRYVIYNYLENTWYDGTINRTVWHDHGVFSNPYAITGTGTLYSHEQGSDDGPRAMPFYLETSYIDIKDGQNLMLIDRVVPDFRFLPNNKSINFTITTKKYPQDPNPVSKGPYQVLNDTKKISLRARGRQVKIRIDSSANGVDFEMGTLKINPILDGER